MGWETIIEQKEMKPIEKLHLICDASLIQRKCILVEANSFSWIVRTITELSKGENK